MLTQYLADGNVIGSTVIPSLDSSLLLMYSSVDGKHFLKSRDLFCTVEESWVVPLDSITANANLLRRKDGSLMTVVRVLSENPAIADIKGADFYTAFSVDEGKSFVMGKKINAEEGCFYLMNHRILRLHSGRILLPVCYVPQDLVSAEFFEKSGCSGCFYSDDDGDTWHRGEWLYPEKADQLAEPMVVQGEGDLVLMYMRTGCGYLYFSVSRDGGVTWDMAEPSCLRSPCAPFTVSFDPYTKKFFAVWDNSFPGLKHQYPRSPICLAISEDGIRWEQKAELDADPMKNYGYPMLHFTEKEILVTYYENNERKFNKTLQKLKMRLISREELL